MAQCSQCKTETQLYVSNVPTCLACVDAQTSKTEIAQPRLESTEPLGLSKSVFPTTF